jgi:hypothetical protein
MSDNTFYLDRCTSIDFFGMKSSTLDIVELLLNTVAFIRQNQGYPNSGYGCIKLVESVSTRLFFFQKEKYFSIFLPFTYREENGELFFYYNSVEIDSTFSSALLSLLRYASGNVIAGLEDFEGEIDAVNEGLVNPGQLNLIYRSLLSEEFGYLRYDFDEKNENGKLHPLNHLDINYSNSATYKLGLENMLCEEDFIDVLNVKTDCWYLRNGKIIDM